MCIWRTVCGSYIVSKTNVSRSFISGLSIFSLWVNRFKLVCTSFRRYELQRELQERSYLHSRETSVHFFAQREQTTTLNCRAMLVRHKLWSFGCYVCEHASPFVSVCQKPSQCTTRDRQQICCNARSSVAKIVVVASIALAVIHSSKFDCKWYFIETLIEINDKTVPFTFFSALPMDE